MDSLSKLVTHFVLLLTLCVAISAHAYHPVNADGDLAPLGAPDSLINTADHLVGRRIVLDHLTPIELEYAHGGIYPPGAPGGVINLQDMLLHNIGPGLASTLVEGNASATEWRIAPLWNICLTAGVSGGEAYLHDGRACNLGEAILWHGGEAEASKQNFVGMTQGEKDALIKFLKTL